MENAGGKYVEKENIHFCGGEKYREGKGRKYLEKENVTQAGQTKEKGKKGLLSQWTTEG